MSTATVDSKRRVVIPSGKPGEVYDVQRQDEGHLLLVRLEKVKRRKHISRQGCLQAMRKAPLRSTMKWEQLRQLTRDL